MKKRADSANGGRREGEKGMEGSGGERSGRRKAQKAAVAPPLSLHLGHMYGTALLPITPS